MNPAHTDRNPVVRQCRTILRWLPALVMLCGATAVYAQNDTLTESESIEGRLLFRQDDGTVVPFEDLGISQKKIEQVIQWLTTQRNVPGYDMTMDASGRVEDGQADIHVDLQIEVHADNEWVRVPVGFQSWTVKDFRHLPDQPEFESRFAGNASTRREWFLRGKGSHTLSMDLIGEVRDREADRQRLKLSMPNAVTASLELTFDHLIENARGTTGTRGPVTSTDRKSTVTFYGLQQETEISWESLATAGNQTTVISAPDPATMTLDLTTGTAVLTCSQTVNITDGTISRLSVRLPPGYGQAAITGSDETGTPVVQSDEITTVDGVSTAEIVFVRPVRRRVQLGFDLRRDKTDFPQEIFVAVPDIDGIPEQSATLKIRSPRGLDVDINPGPLTKRIRVESQPDLRSEETAYELLSTEAKIQLNVSEQEARFAVDPQLEFSTKDQRLLLLAQFAVNVSSGSLDELLINWQHFAEDGWQIEPGTIYLVEGETDQRKRSHDVPDDDTVRVLLDSLQSGLFSVRFQAFRDLIPTADEDRGAFHLPDVIASTSHQTVVSLIESDTYALSLTNAEDGSSFSMVASRKLVNPEDPDRVTTWLVNNSGSLVRVDQSPQTLEVSSTAVVDLTAENESIQVHAEIDINVKHRDLRELRFTAADGLLPALELSSQSEPLPPGEPDGDELVWQLPEPIRGQHKVSLRYQWTPDIAEDERRLPLILPVSGLESLIIGTKVPDVISVVHDASIRPIYPGQFEAAWHANQPLPSVELNIPQALRHHQPRLPSICFVETQIGPVNVTTKTTVIYETPPKTVSFSVPANAGISATVNGRRINAPKTELDAMDAGEIRSISIPSGLPDDAVSVSLKCQIPRGPHHHLLSRETPIYPRIVRPPEWLTTVWLVSTLDNDRLVSLDSRQHSLLGGSLTKSLLLSPTDRISRSLDTIRSTIPDNVSTRVQQHFDESTIGRTASLAFVAGPELQSVPLLIYSQATGWMMAAGLGILLYTVLVSFRRHLKTVLALLIPACVLIWGLLPQQTLNLLFPVLPAVMVAGMAWVIRRLLLPSSVRRQSRRRRQTVFAAAPRSQPHSSLANARGSAAPIAEAEPAVQ